MKKLKIAEIALEFPTFIPVTTWGRYPVDDLIRPHLFRFSQMAMLSYYYGKKMKQRLEQPTFFDSGGFAGLFEGSQMIDRKDHAAIITKYGEEINPQELLAVQIKYADIAATLDFICPPGLNLRQYQKRQGMTIKNAIWTINNLANKEKPLLFASLQAWDYKSARDITKALACYPFAGFALGGMVSRVKKPKEILEIVSGIRSVDNERPLHLFGIGHPTLLAKLFAAGVDSTDSSAFVQNAVNKRYLDPSSGKYKKIEEIISPSALCACRICRLFSQDYLALEGDVNNMALALHNLAALRRFLRIGSLYRF